MSVDPFADRFRFDEWREPRAGADALFIWRFAFGGAELAGHHSVRVEVVEQPEGPPSSHRSGASSRRKAH